jgi:hypothetical protein
MSITDLGTFLEGYNIMTYGLRGRRVALEKDRVCWIRRTGTRVTIYDWSAALECAGYDLTKEALILMGAQVCDFRLQSEPKEA